MWNWIEKLHQTKEAGHRAVLVTVVRASGSTPREVGAKMLCLENGEFYGTVGGGHLEELALNDARSLLRDVSEKKRHTYSQSYPLGAKTGQCCGGVVDLLFERIGTGPKLFLFGAGHVGQAVCKTLEGTPFEVHVIDERAEWVLSDKLPQGVKKHHVEWDEFVESAHFDKDDAYAVVMTHRHDLDQEIVEALLKKPLRYLGLIGSDSKWARFKQRFEMRGITEAEYARVRCPLGLEIGGKAPQEVAISLAAELLKTHYEKP